MKPSRQLFEAQLAKLILEFPEVVGDIVKKVSNKIVDYLQQLDDRAISHFFSEEKEFARELFNKDRFGRFGDQTYKKGLFSREGALGFFHKVLHELKYPSADFPLVMHIHGLFFQHILPRLPINSQQIDPHLSAPLSTERGREKLRNLFYLYPHHERGRQESSPEHHKTTRNLTPQTPNHHQTYRLSFMPAFFVYEPNTESQYWKDHSKHPFISGASGHTGIFLRGFLQIISATQEELKSYLLSIIGFLVGGGMHSWHEIMVTARCVGIRYHDGDYNCYLPVDFQQNPLFKQLKKNFSELFEETQAYAPEPADCDFYQRLSLQLS